MLNRQQEDKMKCKHIKNSTDLPAEQYKCPKCGEWISELYFYNKEKEIKEFIVPNIKGEVIVKLAKGVRFEPTFKVLEFEKNKKGEMIIKKAELIELSLVFDN